MKDCVLFYPIVSDHLINIFLIKRKLERPGCQQTIRLSTVFQGMVKHRRPSDSYKLVFKVTFKTSRNAFSWYSSSILQKRMTARNCINYTEVYFVILDRSLRKVFCPWFRLSSASQVPRKRYVPTQPEFIWSLIGLKMGHSSKESLDLF